MRDIVPSVDDRKRLVVLLAQLFPDNDSARRLLDLVRYPSRRWPGFTGKPIEGWQETLRDFDESRPDDTPYSELLIGIKRIYPAQTELAQLANRYHAETRITQQRPSVLVVGAEDEGSKARSRWSRERSVIEQAHRNGYVNVQVCSATTLNPVRVGQLKPEYVHVNGRCDGEVISFDDGAVPADQLVNCFDQSITNDRVTIRGIVLDGGRHGQQLLGKFRPITEFIAMHDGDVNDELGVRFAEKLYQLLQLAPRFEAAVDAAYHFVFHHRYGSTGNPGRILCWAAPQDEGRAGNGHLSSARGVFTRRQNTDINISLSPEDFDTFERTLVSLYKSNPEKSRSLMKFAGFPSELRNELIGNDRADWHNAFIALDNGQVSQKETPFRRMLEWASRDCPGNAELQRLAEKYLDSGGVGR